MRVSSSSSDQDEASAAFRDFVSASEILVSILVETSCGSFFRGKWEGIGNAIEIHSTVCRTFELKVRGACSVYSGVTCRSIRGVQSAVIPV